MELDHVFVMCDVGAPEADGLIARGLREGSPNTHPGQGTACRRFFFENAYLELVWVAEPAEAQSAVVAGTRLWERWVHRRSDASPFGIVLRGGSDPDATDPTWPTWSYRPAWLPGDQAIEFADGQALHEPAIIALPFVSERSRMGAEPLDHDVPLTRLVVASFGYTRRGTLSVAAQALHAAGIATFTSSDEPVARLRFAAGLGTTLGEPALPGRNRPPHARTLPALQQDCAGRLIDLRPVLPIVLEW
jgi:hypothetical protein